MFNNLFSEIDFGDIWSAYVSEFVDIDEIITESKAPQNEQVKVTQSQEISKKKIFEDTDGEYVDFVEL